LYVTYVNRPGESDEQRVEELVAHWKQQNIDDNITVNFGLVILFSCMQYIPVSKLLFITLTFLSSY